LESPRTECDNQFCLFADVNQTVKLSSEFSIARWISCKTSILDGSACVHREENRLGPSDPAFENVLAELQFFDASASFGTGFEFSSPGSRANRRMELVANLLPAVS
jgi:hypothetical protein